MQLKLATRHGSSLVLPEAETDGTPRRHNANERRIRARAFNNFTHMSSTRAAAYTKGPLPQLKVCDGRPHGQEPKARTRSSLMRRLSNMPCQQITNAPRAHKTWKRAATCAMDATVGYGTSGATTLTCSCNARGSIAPCKLQRRRRNRRATACNGASHR